MEAIRLPRLFSLCAFVFHSPSDHAAKNTKTRATHCCSGFEIRQPESRRPRGRERWTITVTMTMTERGNMIDGVIFHEFCSSSSRNTHRQQHPFYCIHVLHHILGNRSHFTRASIKLLPRNNHLRRHRPIGCHVSKHH